MALVAMSSVMIEEIHILFETTIFHIKQAQQNPLKIAFNYVHPNAQYSQQ